ncbi:MAG TPA: zinc-binding dehydrogenase [Candidatus Anaerostipes excrementavium]|uniref:Zinc-binding dehydrogenase n=1 Tax=Candidatus Anaerostipes excrementavium TaxID=2838463 RepID=A0A9D1WVS8_9FIRM|nr:zinc-binding dehydrogenase [uncultured Anaerostipes sp.]HIX67956.1 zinc-binding dehydrogenase [Candidatus Anaerostipes excrementavium]
MKVEGVRMYGAKDIRLEEFDLPDIKEDEVLLKVMSDSICMSTWKEVKLGSGHIRVPDNIHEKPVIIGHELSGRIAKVGAKWADEYKEGERFVVLPGIPGQMGAPGYSYEFFGGAATYCIVPNDVIEKGCLLHYEGDSFFEVSVSEPMYCIIGGYKANYHTKPETHEHFIGTKEGGNIAILGGCGPMGLGAVSYALATEQKPKMVVVTDIDDERLDRARSVISEQEAEEKGVELHYINTAQMEDEAKELLDLTGGEGYHDVFVYAPVRQIAETGNRIMAFDGCMNLFAGPADSGFSAEMNLYDAHYRNTKILGSSGGIKTDLLEALDLISQKKVKPAVMITHIGGLDAYADTTLHLPEIPGGKKLIYTQFHMPLTAIEDFRKMGEEDPLFTKLADACDRHNGLWNKEAEDILLNYFEV